MPQQRNLCRIELSRRQSCPCPCFFIIIIFCPCGKDYDDHDHDDDDLVLVENWELSRIVNVVPKQFKC